jgi:hypothetical protein
LGNYASAGANVYRQWIHFDGNKQLQLWDNNNKFKTLDSKFVTDAIDNLKTAKDKNIQVILTLFSFECADNTPCEYMITNNSATEAYIQNGLTPLLDRIK